MSAPQQARSGEITARGRFVATFPYYGGLSRERLARHVRWPFLELAEAEGV
ncbi:hypothetical protein ACFU1Q_11345 [Brachybacterium paraconglomeratum]